MTESEAKPNSDRSLAIPVTDLTVENLIRQGFPPDIARAVVEYANLLTGSNRRIDKDFLDAFKNKGDNLERRGISVKQAVVEIDTSTQLPIRKIYTVDWQRPDYVPRGQRGEPTLNFPILKKEFVINTKMPESKNK